MRSLRFGVVGCGAVAERYHLPAQIRGHSHAGAACNAPPDPHLR